MCKSAGSGKVSLDKKLFSDFLGQRYGPVIAEKWKNLFDFNNMSLPMETYVAKLKDVFFNR